MKGIIGNQKGILLPYEEYCEKIGLPEKYFIYAVHYTGGRYVHFTLIEKESCELKEGLVFIKRREKSIYLRIAKEEINKKLGIQLEHPFHHMCYKTKENNIELLDHGEGDERVAALIRKDKDIYMWISSGPNYLVDEEVFFIETK